MPTDEPVIELGLGVASEPDYAGARSSRRHVAPDLRLSYTSEALGNVLFSTSAGGLLWAPFETAFVSAGPMLSYDSGRKDQDTRGQRPGSARLQGMGSIGGSLLFGAFALTRFAGAEWVGHMLKSPGGKGTGGTQFGLSVERKLIDQERVDVSLSGRVAWADRRYMQAYFGVTSAQSARSGLPAYEADGGLRSAGVSLESSYALSTAWRLRSAVGVDRLLGSAAHGPVTERRNQPSASVVLVWRY